MSGASVTSLTPLQKSYLYGCTGCVHRLSSRESLQCYLSAKTQRARACAVARHSKQPLLTLGRWHSQGNMTGTTANRYFLFICPFYRSWKYMRFPCLCMSMHTCTLLYIAFIFWTPSIGWRWAWLRLHGYSLDFAMAGTLPAEKIPKYDSRGTTAHTAAKCHDP